MPVSPRLTEMSSVVARVVPSVVVVSFVLFFFSFCFFSSSSARRVLSVLSGSGVLVRGSTALPFPPIERAHLLDRFLYHLSALARV